MSKLLLPKIFPVACHTDHIGPGSTFVVIKGMQQDGVDYIFDAIKKGATKVVVENATKLDVNVIELIREKNIELVRCSNARQTLAQLSAQAAGFPASKLQIIGVTGTKGKTTTCFLLEHLLSKAGYKTALLSTVHNKINDTIFTTNLTTQQPDYLHVFFNECVKNSVDYVVMEVAAQAVSLNRIDGIFFNGIIFTNFDLEHLEFYFTIQDYFEAKCRIFDYAKENAPVLLNADDQWCKKINRSGLWLSFIDKNVDCVGVIIQNNSDGLKLSINNFEFLCPTLFGEFNAYNCAMAVSLLLQLGISTTVLQKALAIFNGVPGRLQCYQLPNGARAFIDKAHNPSSYKAVLSTLRSMTDHLIVVFGCGGQRDTSKRPIMGGIASELCDVVVVTSDDPRSEDPQSIIDDILVGIDKVIMNKVICEVDREKAIRCAYSYAKTSSIIAILGKGTDKYQLINGTKHYFNERVILQSLSL